MRATATEVTASGATATGAPAPAATASGTLASADDLDVGIAAALPGVASFYP